MSERTGPAMVEGTMTIAWRITMMGPESCNITIHKGDLAMKSNNYLIGLSILFFVFAAAFSVVFWGDVLLAAKVGFFALGFGSGVTAGQWFARRSA
jgi:hypothetical protein